MPVLLVRPEKATGSCRPSSCCTAPAATRKASAAWLTDLAKRGIIGVAIDARYHGDRSGGAKGSAAYNEAITRAWKTKPGEPQEHPFYYDTCWDLWRTVDYLRDARRRRRRAASA